MATRGLEVQLENGVADMNIFQGVLAKENSVMAHENIFYVENVFLWKVL